MSTQVRSVDRDKFALAWITKAKDHLRVEHDRDDDVIKDKLVQAATRVEHISGKVLIPREVIWRPGPQSYRLPTYAPQPWTPGAYGYAYGYSYGYGPLCGCRIPDAAMPLRSFRAEIGGEDRTPAWKLVGDLDAFGAGERWLVRASGTIEGWADPGTSDWVFFLKAGFGDPNNTPPLLVDSMMRRMAHLYENRELMVGQGQVSPDVEGADWAIWEPRI